MTFPITRRALVAGAGVSTGLALAGCDKLGNTPAVQRVLGSAETVHRTLQRGIASPYALAPEYGRADMSPIFRVNGTANPNTPAYNALVAHRFADWRLEVGGLVARPLRLSLEQLRAMPTRTQITRHDCVEGWSAIGQWHGPMLGTLLNAAGVRAAARYIVLTCADLFGGQPYYESLDLIDAFHPQTILAWAMNGHALSVEHGAPVRLRVERKLGYKHAKYVMRVDAVADFASVRGGKGGYWEDSTGYDWYAGI